MKRQQSSMLASDLQAWRERHGHTYDTAAEALGITRRQFAYYLSGEPIPPTVAHLCDALDALALRRKYHNK